MVFTRSKVGRAHNVSVVLEQGAVWYPLNRQWAQDVIEAWSVANAEEAGRVDSAIEELDTTGSWTLSKLAIASTQLREMAQNAEP